MRIADIATAAQLAVLLEVSAPKPGNVAPGRDFEDTRYEHFLASAAAFAPVAREAAQRGYSAAKGRLAVERIGIGRMIKKAVMEARRWHRGGNTILGEAMLLLPLCAGAGYVLTGGRLSLSSLRKSAQSIVRATTCTDAVELYRGIRAVSPRLRSSESLDVFDPRSLLEIKERRITLYQVMRMSEGDSVARELVEGYPTTFELGYPALLEAYKRTADLRSATVECFLRILARVPDSLIVKKAGERAAEEVSRRAGEVLKEGMTEEALQALDSYLRRQGNLLNPGTTADLVAASLFVALVGGIKP